MTDQADIHIQVARNSDMDIERITWQATDATTPTAQEAKAIILALWDADARQSLRIDLWTKDMTVHDMNDFFFQTLLSMADTYGKATQNQALKADIMQFARDFAAKAAQTERKITG